MNASSAFNSPTETLTNFRIVNTTDGLVVDGAAHAAGRVSRLQQEEPGHRRARRRADRPLAEVHRRRAEVRAGPADHRQPALAAAQASASSSRWRSPSGSRRPTGPRILVPYLEYKGFLIRRPVLGGVFVVAPGGKIEDLEPEEAARRPELAAHRAASSPTRRRAASRRPTSSRAACGTPGSCTRTRRGSPTPRSTASPTSSTSARRASARSGSAVAEPYGRAFAASAIFLTDATTGRRGSGACRGARR